MPTDKQETGPPASSSRPAGTTAPERRLALFLRWTAALLLLALPAVVLPHAWMDAIHQWLGLGPLPELPMVAYLARSESALYGVLAALYWHAAGDVRRYLPLLRV